MQIGEEPADCTAIETLMREAFWNIYAPGCRAHGTYDEGDIYRVDEAALAAFDKAFPHKPKKEDTPTRQKFQQLLAMVRSADNR